MHPFRIPTGYEPALAARFRKQAKLTGHGKGEGSIGKCPTCGKQGHGNDKCWELHPELAPEGYFKTGSAAKSTRLNPDGVREIKSF